jgi:GntR family transcriptional regulator, rspAB operon transcriptional repressor
MHCQDYRTEKNEKDQPARPGGKDMAMKTYGRTSNGKANISETVYSILYKNIVNLTLAPGTMISEMDIAERLQVSRTPVREAFIKLSNEALVNIFPQKGTFVSKIDLSRVQEERFLRESLELAVLERFVTAHTEESIDRLKMNLKKQKSAIDQNDLAKFIDYDDQFHAIMFDESRKNLCYSIIQRFSSHYRRIRYLSLHFSKIYNQNIEQHQEIVEAVEKQDTGEATAILKRHIRKLIIEKDEICEKYPEYFQQEERFIGDSDIFETSNELQKLLSDTSLFAINDSSRPLDAFE